MEKLKNFLRSTTLVGRIFIAIWVFMCLLITLLLLSVSTKDEIGYVILFLGISYVFFSMMFLIPAITITQAQRAKANKENSRSSEKSYWITLLLAVFLGMFGAHRFYVGKKITGLLYVLTIGGLGIGWVVDIVLVATGMFLDQNENRIVFPWHRRRETDNGLQDEEKSEIIKDSEQIQDNTEEPSLSRPLFSDVVIPGEAEKKQEIPAKSVEQDTGYEKPSFSVEISVVEKPKSEMSRHSTVSYTYGFPDNFFREMKTYENKVGQKAEFVPFMQYSPTYDSMDRSQQAWYFYWRTQVRKGEYPDTDLSYIFVHIYELLSHCGWKQASDGYNQLISLWTAYRERFPKLDYYLVKWSFDFTQVYQLKYSEPEIQDLPLYTNSLICNVLIGKHRNEAPLKLPFSLICSLCDYSIVGSKFYKDGHQKLMQEAIPRVVALADALLLKKKQSGLLAIYGPKSSEKKQYHVFQSAVCPKRNKEITISIVEYTGSKILRYYINQLVRYSENVLREIYGYRGRLRGVELDSRLSELIREFLIKEYTIDKKDSPKKTEIELNFNNIASLRAQSDAVREALAVTNEEEGQKELLTDLSAISDMFTSLSQSAQKFLLSLKETGWEKDSDTETNVFVEEINAAATRVIARELIVVEDGRYIVEDDYRDELDYIYEHTSRSDISEEKEDSQKTETKNDQFDESGLSEEMKQMVDALIDIQRRALRAILVSDNPQEELTRLAEESMSMPEMLIDEINDTATQFLDDILIDTVDDTPTVLEQYADELKHAIK